MSSRFGSLRGRKVTLGQGIPQKFPIELDPGPFEGAIVYAENGVLKYSNGTAWVDLGAGPQGTTGYQGVQGVQGLQGEYGPGFTIIGSVADVDTGGDPQATLNAAFPGASVGDGVIDQADDELWIYDGTNWINIGSFRGVQGFTGIQGKQGVQGPIGEEGIQGSRGFRGQQGVQGVQGFQGSKGSQGVQGVQGIQGFQASQGVQGVQGTQGVQGSQGIQGPQAYQGVQGSLGNQGAQGIVGAFGGVTVRYTYYGLDITDSDPGIGFIKGNNATFGNSTVLYIDVEDADSVIISALLAEFYESTNPNSKGYLKVADATNPYNYFVFEVTGGELSGLAGTGYYKITVSSVIGGGVGLTHSTDVRLSFVRTGDQGSQGVQGTQGLDGNQGDQGVQGVQGPQAYQGVQGIQGEGGFQGHTGYDGGLTFEWTYNSSTTEGFPGLNSWLLNNANVQLASRLYIDDLTDTGKRVDGLFDFLDTITSNPKGQIFIRTRKDVNDDYEFLIYNYSDWTWSPTGTGKDWGHFDITLVDQSTLGGTDASPGNSWTTGAAATFGTDTVFAFIPAGSRGFQGFQGFQGSQGFQGAKGDQGVQGIQGVQSTQGLQGLQGSQGVQGSKGEQGVQGVQGIQGDRGYTGAYGGMSFEYNFLSDVSVSDPGAGNLKFSDSVLANATILRISDEDANGNDLDPFLRTIDDSTSTIKGYFKVISALDPSIFAIYQINDLTEITTYFAVGCTFIAGNATSGYFTANPDVIITFTRNGDKGVQGVQGIQGVQGFQGFQGDLGLQGDQGVQGIQSVQGVQGDDGPQGDQGVQGVQSTQGVQGGDGPQGDQGVQGVQSTQGIQGDLGLQGVQGLEGNRTFEVVNDGSSAWEIDGVTNNPSLNLLRGFTYVFNVNAAGHPFWIKTDPGTGTGDQYNNGVTNNGTQVGQVIFRVPGDAPDTLYYQCQLHASMVGQLNISDLGPQGPQGPQGIQGGDGVQGPTGSFGGVTFDYTFDSSTVASNPGFGRLKLNNSAFASASIMFISERDDNFTNILSFLQTIDDSTSTIKGHFKITEAANPASFVIYTISAVNYLGGYFAVDCGYVSSSQANAWSNNTDIIITFARTGDIGDQGDQGVQGVQGEKGIQGPDGGFGNPGDQGVQGIQGGDGIQGPQGFVGDPGDQGVQGIQSVQGVQGVQGAGGQGNQGVQGGQGVQGIGGDGIQGDQGVQGTEGQPGQPGPAGDQGVQGIQGGDGPQGSPGGAGLGAQGVQGVQGIQGEEGAQGADGDGGGQGPQGFQGIQGAIGAGADGGQGPQGVQGIQGPRGEEGLGFQGPQGVQGEKGVQGVPGAGDPGEQGDQGVQGAQGTQGFSGSGGSQGPQGFAGDVQGIQGIQGNDGFGNDGDQGVQGVQGKQGVQGETGFGVAGDQGVQGVQGKEGSQGFPGQGANGDQGVQGVQGFQGRNPLDGTDGEQGVQGVQGVTGDEGDQGVQGIAGDAQGPQGPQGFVGADGEGSQGVQGEQGVQGVQSVQGPQGPAGSTTADAINIENIHNQSAALQSASMFIPFFDSSQSGGKTLYATTGPNPGGDSNFFYQSSTDELSVENIDVAGNALITGDLTVNGTINGGGIGSNTITDTGNDVKSGGSIRLNDGVDLYFGTGQDMQLYYDGSDMYIDFNTASDSIFFRNTSDTIVTSLDGSGNLTVNDLSVATGALSAAGSTAMQFTSSIGDYYFNYSAGTSFDGPTLDLYRNSPSPAQNDQLGFIDITGNDAALNKVTYAKIESRISGNYSFDTLNYQTKFSIKTPYRVAGINGSFTVLEADAGNVNIGNEISISNSGTTFSGNVSLASYTLTSLFVDTYGIRISGNSPSEDSVIVVSSASAASFTPLSSLSGVAAGTVSAFAGSSAPTGYLLCNGSAVSRTTYSALFSVIGTTYGAGDGSTTFNVPDLRGYFIRGLDARSSGNVDPYYQENSNTIRPLGSTQGDALEDHAHDDLIVDGWAADGQAADGSSHLMLDASGNTGKTVTTVSTGSVDGTGAAVSTNETRPVNIAMNYIIKT